MKKLIKLFLISCLILVLVSCQNREFACEIYGMYYIDYAGGYNKNISFAVDNNIYNPVVIGCTKKYKHNNKYIVAQIDIYNDNIELAKNISKYSEIEYLEEICGISTSEIPDKVLKTYWILLNMDNKQFKYFYDEVALLKKVEEMNIDLPEEWILIE